MKPSSIRLLAGLTVHGQWYVIVSLSTHCYSAFHFEYLSTMIIGHYHCSRPIVKSFKAPLLKIIFRFYETISPLHLLTMFCTAFVAACAAIRLSKFVVLRASAMLKHVDIAWTSVRPSVRLSVCPSHAGTVSKRLNILS